MIKYIGVSTSTTMDMESLYKEFGQPLDIYTGKNVECTVCILSGLTYPYAVLKQFKERIERDQPAVVKNIQTTGETRLSSGVNFLDDMEPVTPDDEIEKPSKEDIFAKYRKTANTG